MTRSADAPTARCPVCGKPVAPNSPAMGRLLPFCSARCADVDLGRWLTGQYRVAGPEADDERIEETPSVGPRAS